MVQIETQGHLLKLKLPGDPPLGTGERGVISEFSRHSRKRMLELLARIDVEKAGFVTFVTLTYPDRNGPPSISETERDRQSFFKRIRRAYPEASSIWRREWERRKSGCFVGVAYPHYHLMVFNLPFVPKEQINTMWAEILDYTDYLRTQIEGMQGWRQAMYYMAKYMAKTPEGNKEGAAPGRSMPSSAVRKAEASGASVPGGEAARSLVYGTYLTGDEDKKEKGEGQRKKSAGRSWGVFNRKHLPVAESKVLLFPLGGWVRGAKEAARAIWANVNDDPCCGFTLFLDEPEGLFAELSELASTSPGQCDNGGPVQ